MSWITGMLAGNWESSTKYVTLRIEPFIFLCKTNFVFDVKRHKALA